MDGVECKYAEPYTCSHGSYVRCWHPELSYSCDLHLMEQKVEERKRCREFEIVEQET
jgi:hypothetical protein